MTARLIVILLIAAGAVALGLLLWPSSQPSTVDTVERAPLSEETPAVAEVLEDRRADEQADTETIAEEEPVEREILRISDADMADVDRLASLLGVNADALRQEMNDWFMKNGIPSEMLGGTFDFYLEQPYDQYDDDTLLAMAQNGDMWAMQKIADRIEGDRPAEALEWYRRAAVEGSVYAMVGTGMLYASIAGTSTEAALGESESRLNQVYALRDSIENPRVDATAWIVTSMLTSGFVAGDTIPGAPVSWIPVEDRASVCERAETFYNDLNDERQSLGMPPLNPTAAPFVFAPEVMGGGDIGCPRPESIPRVDTNACRQLEIGMDNDALTAWYCGNAQ